MKRLFPLFASTAPGLERFAEAEIRALGAAEVKVVPGGVEVSADRATMFQLLVELRTVSHLLLRVAKFRADSFERFEREVRRIDWRAWLVPGVRRESRATAEKSRLFHTGAITERLDRWLGELLEDEGASEGEPIAVVARLVHDEVTLSIDLSGEPLHRRGYRRDPGKAPLREDLAAALVIASGFDGSAPLLDPMCGSGTVAIEAAMIAGRIAPGRARGFAIERTAIGRTSDVERARRAAREKEAPRAAPIRASDRDPAAVERSLANAARAGIEIAVETAAVSSVAVDDLVGTRPFVVTNPPWGERLDDGGAGLDRLHASLGALVKRLGPGTRLALIAHDPRIARSVGVPLRSAFLTDAGGLKVRALVSETAR